MGNKKKDAADRHLLLATLGGAEAMLDTLLSSEVAKAIPVLNVAVATLKTVDGIRNAALIAKLTKFLTDESLRKSWEAQEIRQKLENDDEAEAIGETLFLTLDKVTDLKKPALLAKVYAAYLDGVIDNSVVLMLAHTIDISFIGDLEHFISTRGSALMDDKLSVHRLSNAGLFATWVSGAIGGGGLNYELSPLGSSFLAALKIAAATSPTDNN